MSDTRIVILGGGFGGLHTALELERALARRSGLQVTLVNRENFFLFTPMLHEVTASDLDVTHRVALDWTLDLVFAKELVQVPTKPSRGTGSVVVELPETKTA